MPKPVMIPLYVAIVVVGLVAMYTILNAGSPDSLLRVWVADPADDVMIAMASSFIVFILGFFVFYLRDRAGFRQMVELNAEKIHSLRRNGVSDEAIAEEILSAMGSRSGYRHNLARKKLLVTLGEFRTPTQE
jgi:hypothetical protein